VVFTTTVKTMTDIWLGRNSYRKVEKTGDIKIVGLSAVTRNVNSWWSNSQFADLPLASEIWPRAPSVLNF